MRLAPLRVAALAFLFCAAGGLAGAAAEPELQLAYDIRYGGVTIMKLDARLDLAEGSGDSYAMALEGRTVGLFDSFKPMAFTAISEGVADGHALRPDRFATTTHKRNKRKALVVDFMPGAAPALEFTPADDAEEPAPPEMLVDSLDPASAMLALIRAVSGSASCSGVVEVFDGKRRYDVTFAALPRQMLHKTSYSLYSGEAKGCRLDMRPLHGFKPGKRRPLDGTVVWFGEVLAGAPPLPVRIETEIALGSIRLDLASVRWADQQASR